MALQSAVLPLADQSHSLGVTLRGERGARTYNGDPQLVAPGVG